MMKIIWICNMIFPEQAHFLGKEATIRGGWLLGMAKALLRNCNQKLIICSFTSLVDAVKHIETEEHDYYLIPNYGDVYKCSSNVFEDLSKIFKDENPDLIHIHGTEFAHSKVASDVCTRLGIKYVISIQGLTSTCAIHYLNNIPYRYQCLYTIRDIIKRQNLLVQKKQFEKRGATEISCLKESKYIIGRTNWDKGSTYIINPQRKYFHSDEILRDSFYTDKVWDVTKCEKNTVFISQAYYPIKGFHTLIKAINLVKKVFPDVKVKVAGTPLYSNKSFLERVKISSYGLYIKNSIKKYNLEKNIEFIGGLEEEDMRQAFLNANVFVSPSIIENESNSVSEAKILGVPTISSYVGGVAERITHFEDGLLYPADEYYMLAYYIIRIFTDNDLATNISKTARINQIKKNDPIINSRSLMEIYEQIDNDSTND